MRCVIIEDEKPAQRILTQFIGNCPELELVGTFKSAMDAQKVLLSDDVDLLFLDINLPLISGISLLKSLKKPPLVIMTTAYSQYALEGYELDVVDYLLKPFPFERFLQAVNKAMRMVNSPSSTSVQAVDKSIEKQVVINVDKVLYRLEASEIRYISSDRDYVCFFTVDRKYVFIDSLKKWDLELHEYGFQRIHKSHLVNVNHIQRVEGNRVFIGQTKLPIGRSYRSRFIEAFTG